MLRDLRCRGSSTPRQSPERKPSNSPTPLLDDDDGYSAVDELSDSDDDDENGLEAVEAEHILNESRTVQSGSPRPHLDTAAVYSEEEVEDHDEEADDEDDEDVEAHIEYNETHAGQRDDDNHKQGHHVEVKTEEEISARGDQAAKLQLSTNRSNSSSSADIQSISTNGSTPVVPQRRVRFVNVPSSDSDSTETDEGLSELFPDIFIDKCRLDPMFRREIDHGTDNFYGASFWNCLDHHMVTGEDTNKTNAWLLSSDLPSPQGPTQTFTPIACDTPIEMSDLTIPHQNFEDLDGSESDGNTTEEEIPQPSTRPNTHWANLESEMSDSDSCVNDASPRSQRRKSSRGTPRLGSFNLDRSDHKPIAVVNPILKKMIIFTPQLQRRFDLSTAHFDLPYFSSLTHASSPIISSSANLMLSALCSPDAFDGYLGFQAISAADTFFQYSSHGTSPDESTTCSIEDEEDAAERNLKLSDFIIWDEESATDEVESRDEWKSKSASISVPSTPEACSASSKISAPIQLNSAVVGAFRLNQLNQKLLLSQMATEDSLAFSGPYNLTALRGLRSDRLDQASTMLTPTLHQHHSWSDMPLTAADMIGQKRKASGEALLRHKRHRSISDVNMLQI